MQRSGRRVDAIECKINPDRLDPEPLRVFRAAYPAGSNYLICPVADPPYDRRYGGLVMRVGSCRTLLAELSSARTAPTARPKPS